MPVSDKISKEDFYNRSMEFRIWLSEKVIHRGVDWYISASACLLLTVN